MGRIRNEIVLNVSMKCFTEILLLLDKSPPIFGFSRTWFLCISFFYLLHLVVSIKIIIIILYLTVIITIATIKSVYQTIMNRFSTKMLQRAGKKCTLHSFSRKFRWIVIESNRHSSIAEDSKWKKINNAFGCLPTNCFKFTFNHFHIRGHLPSCWFYFDSIIVVITRYLFMIFINGIILKSIYCGPLKRFIQISPAWAHMIYEYGIKKYVLERKRSKKSWKTNCQQLQNKSRVLENIIKYQRNIFLLKLNRLC